MQVTIIISIISGIITLITSVLITTIKNRSELLKIHVELEQKYATSLFEKRLNVYPTLFKILSDFNKLIEYNIQTKDKLLELQKNLDEWNNEYAILLTTTSSRMAYSYRYYLIDLFQKYSKKDIPQDVWNNIRTLNVAFEKSIRAEIGIYDIRAAGVLNKESEKVEKICGKIIETMHNKLK